MPAQADAIARLEAQLARIQRRIEVEKMRMARVLGDPLGSHSSPEDIAERQSLLTQLADVLHSLQNQYYSIEATIRKLKQDA